ncbi:MAG: DUF1328 domain-containing protein [Erythrobacter sp.]
MLEQDGFIRNNRKCQNLYEENVMLRWSATFLVIALIAAILGFGGLAGTATNIAYILFVVFLLLSLVAFIRRNA